VLPSGSRNQSSGRDGVAEAANLGVDVHAALLQLRVVGVDVVGLERDAGVLAARGRIWTGRADRASAVLHFASEKAAIALAHDLDRARHERVELTDIGVGAGLAEREMCDWPGFNVPESNAPEPAVAVCAVLSVLVTVTVAPALTVNALGENA
jgi:hypothetical protein